MIVGIQHKANIFERNQQEYGPEDERDGAHDIGLCERYLAMRMGPKEYLPEGVQDGGPNIAIDHPAGPHHKQSKDPIQHLESVDRMRTGWSRDRGIK